MPGVHQLTHPEPERGAVSVFVIMMATIVLIVMGVAVDTAGHIHAMQEARSVAREAARAGGQHLQIPTAVRGEGAVVDPSVASAAANAYLESAGIGGSASVTGPESIHVTVTSTYDTTFLSIIGIGGLSATGEADARVARSHGGVEQ
ncbi:TadE/TadG family type IV pilus assembly protein [Ornithinimicrobium murale]|uniref:TadE/TadG family type IV pilus assembly protein n=1 Tax=Ornithinimicrobium murale TaxID=1050153 RepID=UPI001EDD96F2|nr:pilus assembly protein [Ornithinimicrobium murale]